MAISPKEKQDIIDTVLKAQKTQTDRKRDIVLKGHMIINPQLLTTNNPSVYGPVYFQTGFVKNPWMAWGQVRHNQLRIKGALVVTSFVDTWISSSGGINGMHIGVYAHTDIPDNLTQHTITWVAHGTGSLYRGDSKYDAWQAAYVNTSPTHLIMEDGELDRLR